MRKIALLASLAVALTLASCNDSKKAEAPPPPQELTAAAIGHYCGMNVLEHPGPKGQILLASQKDPVWFSSARDTISFTMLPEEPKDIRAIYVSDMAKAASWEKPGASNWIDAKQAFFVIGSRARGGMGAEEAVPFSSRSAAEKFASDNGGRITTFVDVPREYILSNADATGPAEPPGTGAQHEGHGAAATPSTDHAH